MIRQLKDILPLTFIVTPEAPTNESKQNIIKLLKITDSTVLDELNDTIADYFGTDNGIRYLSQEFCFNRLDKILSPVYNRFINYYIDNLSYSLMNATISANEQLSKVILNKFLDKWNRIANAFLSDYNPINNYDMVENEGTSVNMKSNTETSDTQKYAGFNSGTTLPTATESEGSSETTGTEEYNNSARELTRSGNIGVTTSQQMIQSEIELRKHNLIDIIFNDIDSVLFLDYYK